MPKAKSRWWAPMLITVGIAALGTAVAYGTLQGEVSAHSVAIEGLETRELEQTQQLGKVQGTLEEMSKSLQRIEGRLE